MFRAAMMAALAGLSTVSAAAPGLVPHDASYSYTYADYTQMDRHSSGQFFSEGQLAGSWSWTPQTSTTSDVSWAPHYSERFSHVGNWVELEGYGSGPGTPLTQVQKVTSERYASKADCSNYQPLVDATDVQRWQHYALYRTPATGYCLDAKGTITGLSGTVVHFRHIQQWSTPFACGNAYYRNRVCIAQHEQWFDDNPNNGPNHQAVWGRRIDRTVRLAAGLGMLFHDLDTLNDDNPKTNWIADGKNYK